MTSEVERTFFNYELSDSVRTLLLNEIGNRRSGRSEFAFNVVDVVLDFDARTATIVDVLTVGVEAVLPLADFTRRLSSSGPPQTQGP
jgi:hypothetical protein